MLPLKDSFEIKKNFMIRSQQHHLNSVSGLNKKFK